MKKTLLILLSIFILLGVTVVIFYTKINAPLSTKDYGFFIKTKDTPASIFYQLKQENIIASDLPLVVLSKIKRFEQTKEGYYFFNKGTSANQFINRLRAGTQSPIRLTFNNTRTLADFAGKISKQLQTDSLSLLSFFENEKIAKSYGFNKANFISMFLPNTYEVYYTITPKEFADRMHKEYLKFWNANRKQKAAALGYTPQQVSTLASIIDEETNKNDEKARIAGVYINRLKRGIPLQADPTLKFALGDFSIKRLLNKHMEKESPYNTYQNAGLPPGPIRQPSISAIDAVLNYEKHNYIYFCARADFSGYHSFAKTLAAHNRNAAKYHRELNKRGIR